MKFNSDSEEEADSALETTMSLIRPTGGRIRTLTSRIAVFVESYSEFWGCGVKKVLRVTLAFFSEFCSGDGILAVRNEICKSNGLGNGIAPPPLPHRFQYPL